MQSETQKATLEIEKTLIESRLSVRVQIVVLKEIVEKLQNIKDIGLQMNQKRIDFKD
jgi:hypothetical protein